MVTNNNIKSDLIIFMNFKINRKLKKHKNSINHNELNGDFGSFVLTSGESIFIDNRINEKTFSNKFNLIKKRFNKFFIKTDKIKVITIANFFDDVLKTKTINEIKNIDEIITHYTEMLFSAETLHQYVLIEKINKKISLIKEESKLLGSDFINYITDEELIAFYLEIKNKSKETSKVLKLTWIENYTKPIPKDIFDKKIKADLLEVFDNYVILHFDPTNTNVELTPVEKAKAADPILFGVISNSNKLYYIGDWIDDECDLTIDIILETLKIKLSNISLDSLKNYIK